MSIEYKTSIRNPTYDDPLAASFSESNSPKEIKSPEVIELLKKADAALQAGKTKHALDIIVRSHHQSLWAMNAMGVCQLRLGNKEEAIDIFRRIALNSGTLALRKDVPTAFKINFATALLADHKVNGCLDILSEIQNDAHPAIQQLRAAIQDWKNHFNLWDRIDWFFAGEPSRPLTLDWPLGELE
jgi:hypothetical protein